jgi:hypothetical protein
MTSREFKAERHKDISVAAWNAALIALLIGMILALVMVSSAHAGDRTWTGKDTALEATYLVLRAMDWQQTLYIAEHPVYYERNILLGKHPTPSQVNQYMALIAISHVVISYALPKTWRTWFQGITIIEVGATVQCNRERGLAISLSF